MFHSITFSSYRKKLAAVVRKSNTKMLEVRRDIIPLDFTTCTSNAWSAPND
jgi:hypothetical protein